MIRQTRSATKTAPAAKIQADTDMMAPIRAAKAVQATSTSKAAPPARTLTKKRPAATSSHSLKSSMPVVKSSKRSKKTSPASPVPEPPRTSSPQPEPKIERNESSYTPNLLPPTLSFFLSDAIDHLKAHDPRFGHFFTHIPCKPFQPPLEAIDPFKTLVTSIIGQQVSWMAARAITKRFKELYGFEGDEGFPSPGQVAGDDAIRLKGVGLSLRKAEYVICLAEHFHDGRLSTELLRDGTDEEISKALIAVRGIGQWTVDMFLMFSLRRPDVLPVGDLGVQKGLLRWALAAHGSLPRSKSGKAAEEARKKYGLNKKDQVIKEEAKEDGSGEINTIVDGFARPTTPEIGKSDLPPTPLTPSNGGPSSTYHSAALHTPAAHTSAPKAPKLPETPNSPGTVKPTETLEISGKDLPPPAPETFLEPMTDEPGWDADQVAPLEEGLSVELMKSRLAGKKAKGGAYLTPGEMDVLTKGWKPYRSLGVYYMWPAGEDF